MSNDTLIREGDIESISRELTRKGRPSTGRLIIDPKGNRIYYNEDQRGIVHITHHEGDKHTRDRE